MPLTICGAASSSILSMKVPSSCKRNLYNHSGEILYKHKRVQYLYKENGEHTFRFEMKTPALFRLSYFSAFCLWINPSFIRVSVIWPLNVHLYTIYTHFYHLYSHAAHAQYKICHVYELNTADPCYCAEMYLPVFSKFCFLFLFIFFFTKVYLFSVMFIQHLVQP